MHCLDVDDFGHRSGWQDATLYGRQDACRYGVGVSCGFWKVSAVFGAVAV